MREISRLLSVRQLQTTPYHAQCNGLVERWNGTLRRMIQKMAAEKPSDWDRYIPVLLFSYREVAQASLGFSPFELVYGRSVRGPMSVLRDIWAYEDINEQTKTTYQYVLELRERLESTCKLAHDELRKTQGNQHKWFNKKAKAKHLKEGDQWPVIWAGVALRWLVTLVIHSYAYLLSNATEVLWRRSASCVASKRMFDLIH